MTIFDLILTGFRNLSRRKARTALTILGVIIGTVSIVSMVSIGIGMNRSFQSAYMENGSMTIIRIEQYGGSMDENGNWQSREQTLNDDLINAIKDVPHIKAIAPVIETSMQMQFGKYENSVQVRAIGVDAFKEFGYPDLLWGTYPNAENDKVLAFSEQSLSNFYYFSGRTYKTTTVDLQKDTITMTFSDWMYNRNPRKKQFKLVVNQNNACLMGESDNYEYAWYVHMSMDYYKQIWKEYANTLTVADKKRALEQITQYSTIYVNVDNIKNVSKVQEDIEALGYLTYSDMQYLEPLQQTSNMIQMVLGAIGGLAMLVSAINIANTMVMSIYERTREIGIMKVLGCKVSDIRKLFLFEAALIGFLGGVIGILISYGVSFGINHFGGTIFATLMQSSGVYDVGDAKFSIIPFWLPLAASLFGMMVGVLAGYFPARRATKISAIEAMKTNS